MTSYDHADSPLVLYYDLFATGPDGDIEFYLDEAQRAGGPVLELGCGTGRVLLPLAAAGFAVTGLDRSPAMLSAARARLLWQPAEMQARVTLVEGDMEGFALGGQFPLVIIPYSSLLLLTTPEAQRAALLCARDHLEPGGRLAFSVFDPNLRMLAARLRASGQAARKLTEFPHPETGHRIVVWETRYVDPAAQHIRQEYVFEELDSSGQMIARTYSTLHLRYVYASEMRYLLELCGYEVEALYGDSQRGPFRHGHQQVWVARRG